MRRTRVKSALTYLLVLPPYVACGVLSVRAYNEPARIREELHRQGAEQAQTSVALCIKWKSEAGGDITPTSSQRVRDNVRAAASAYHLLQCEDITGDLPPIDPEAYVPAAPTPSTTPR